MIIKLLVNFQLLIVYVVYIFTKLFIKSNSALWVIGTSETAQNIYRLGRVINPSLTVALSRKQNFYDYDYDYKLGFISNNYIRLIVRFFYGPILLAFLSNKASNFFYISGVGFLVGVGLGLTNSIEKCLSPV